MTSKFNKSIKRTTAGILAMTVVLGANAAVCSENFKSNGNYPVANAASNEQALKGIISSLRGDANCDGTVDETDAQEVINYYAYYTTAYGHLLTEQGLKNADVDNNGYVNPADATYILRYLENGYWFDEEPTTTTTTSTTTNSAPISTTPVTETESTTTTTAPVVTDNRTYAHNYAKNGDGRIALERIEDETSGFSEMVIYQKDISKLTDKAKYDNMICAFSILSDIRNSASCVDYFVSKDNFDNENFEFFAITQGDDLNGNFKILYKDAKGLIQPGYRKLRTTASKIINKDGLEEIIINEPKSVDLNSETAGALFGKHQMVYFPKDMTLYFYDSHRVVQSFRDVDEKVGILNPDCTVTLFDYAFRLGDVNHDCNIDKKDVDIIMDDINKVKPLDKKFFWSADVNGDNVIDIEDVVAIKNHINGDNAIPTKFNVIKSEEPVVTTTTTSSVTTTTTTAKSTEKTTTTSTTNTTVFTTKPESTTTTTATTTSDTTTTPVTTTAPAAKSGDTNNDGAVNLKDVVLLRRYIAGGWGVQLDENIADVNKDGDVNLKDVVLLRRYIAGGWGVTLK